MRTKLRSSTGKVRSLNRWSIFSVTLLILKNVLFENFVCVYNEIWSFPPPISSLQHLLDSPNPSSSQIPLLLILFLVVHWVQSVLPLCSCMQEHQLELGQATSSHILKGEWLSPSGNYQLPVHLGMSSWAPPPLHADFQVAWSSADLKQIPTAAVSLISMPHPGKQLFPALLPTLKSFKNYEILLTLTDLSLWTVKYKSYWWSAVCSLDCLSVTIISFQKWSLDQLKYRTSVQ